MRVFLFIFAGLMLIGGATSIALGIDFIQIERGWTQIIAGASVFAGGAVLLGLAAVVTRLDRLVRVLSAKGDAATQPAASAAQPRPAAAKPPVTEVSPASPIGAATNPLFQRGVQASPPLTPEATVPALTLPHFDESQFPSAGLEGAETKAAIPIEPAGAEEPVQALPAAGARSSPAYQGADRTVTPAEAAPAPADLALSRPAEPVVMGRYEAKDASYVMFSDGSIEANTKSGVFRFNSMSELKAFIEAQA